MSNQFSEVVQEIHAGVSGVRLVFVLTKANAKDVRNLTGYGARVLFWDRDGNVDQNRVKAARIDPLNGMVIHWLDGDEFPTGGPDKWAYAQAEILTPDWYGNVTAKAVAFHTVATEIVKFKVLA